MPRYWVIAPYHADKPQDWQRVWKYDLDHKLISIGWSELGDVSTFTEAELRELVDRTYKNDPPGVRTFTVRTLWEFYHTIKPGHVIVAHARRRRMTGIGSGLSVALQR